MTSPRNPEATWDCSCCARDCAECPLYWLQYNRSWDKPANPGEEER